MEAMQISLDQQQEANKSNLRLMYFRFLTQVECPKVSQAIEIMNLFMITFGESDVELIISWTFFPLGLISLIPYLL